MERNNTGGSESHRLQATLGDTSWFLLAILDYPTLGRNVLSVDVILTFEAFRV